MAHNDQHPIFIAPCKDAIKAALVRAGLNSLDVEFNAIERNGSSGARITNSQRIPSVANLEGSPSNGRVRKQWRGDDGKLWLRSRRSELIMHFDVKLWSDTLSKSTGYMFDLIRFLPASITDAMPIGGLTVQPADEHGNPIILTIIQPIFPDDTTNTAKRYEASCIVRAEGALWLDAAPLVSVDVTTQLSPTFASP
jgi:hypothetical protein